MARLEVHPFSAEFVEDAGRLLAGRHRAHRGAEPLLPPEYENPAAAAAEVEALAAGDDASGAVALRGDRVVGFLLGSRRDDEIWGPNVWVEFAGHAVEEAEDLRDLYAAAAARWLDEGRAAALRARTGERRCAGRRVVSPLVRPAARGTASARCPTSAGRTACGGPSLATSTRSLR